METFIDLWMLGVICLAFGLPIASWAIGIVRGA